MLRLIDDVPSIVNSDLEPQLGVVQAMIKQIEEAKATSIV
jgi:hypothetical protein